MAEPTTDQIGAFQRGWHEQDRRNAHRDARPGDRTRAGLTAALSELTMGQIHDVATPAALLYVLEQKLVTESARERAWLKARLTALAESIEEN